jgi:hypothetical protein
MKEQEGRRCPVWNGWYQYKSGEGGEETLEGEYNANTMYRCM